MTREAGALYGETMVHAPTDGDHIMIDCHPKLFRAAELVLQFSGSTLQVRRADEAPLQIRRILHTDRFGAGVLGFRQATPAVELEFVDQWRLWLPTDPDNTADEQGVNKFAYLVGCYGARALEVVTQPS